MADLGGPGLSGLGTYGGYLLAEDTEATARTKKYNIDMQQQAADAFKASLPGILQSMGPGGLAALNQTMPPLSQFGPPGAPQPGAPQPPPPNPMSPPGPQPPGAGIGLPANDFGNRFAGAPLSPGLSPAPPQFAAAAMPPGVGGAPGGQPPPGPPPQQQPAMPQPPMQQRPPLLPPQQQPMGQQQPQQQLDWRTILQKTVQANPNASGGAILGAVNAWVPLMNSQSQQEWRAVQMQWHQQEAADRRERTSLERRRVELMEGGDAGQREPGEPLKGGDELMAQAIAGYRKAPLTLTYRNPQNRRIMERVLEINPDYDEKQWKGETAGATATGRATAMTAPGAEGATPESKLRTEDEFTRGASAKTVTSLNTVTQHLDLLREVSTALKNKDIKFLNSIRQRFAEETGKAVPTDFNAVRDIVSDEIVKAITGGAGAVFDRAELRDRMSRANSPQQLSDAIKYYIGLASGQLSSQEQKYKAGSGRDDFRTRFLTPETIKVLGTGRTTGGGGDDGFDRDAARKAGYTDKEIDDYLRQRRQ